MPLVEQSRESLHDVVEKGKARRSGASQKVVVVLVWVVARGTMRAVMWVDTMLSVTQRKKMIAPLDDKQTEVE